MPSSNERREQVIRGLMGGLPNAEIAKRYKMARRTVKHWLSVLYREFGVSASDDTGKHPNVCLAVAIHNAGECPCEQCAERRNGAGDKGSDSSGHGTSERGSSEDTRLSRYLADLPRRIAETKRKRGRNKRVLRQMETNRSANMSLHATTTVLYGSKTIVQTGMYTLERGSDMWLTALLSLIPQIVSGIETIHGEAKSGADKKKMAMDALHLAVAGAAGVAPGQLGAIQAAGGLASDVIDGTVALYNQIGWPHEQQKPAVPNAKRFTIPVK